MKVQLYGGGIDSVCVAHLWRPDIKVYFAIGTEESAQEARVARDAGCVTDHRLLLGDQVLPNKILPARNLILAALASFYGNEIIMGSTAGDTTRDKDANFIEMTSVLLDYILGHDPEKAQPFHAGGVSVSAPALKYTKTQLVAEYLRNDGDYTTLLDSRSCYSGDAKECGVCRSCQRKYVALRLNGIECDPLFAVKPDLEVALAYAVARERGQECDEIRKLLRG